VEPYARAIANTTQRGGAPEILAFARAHMCRVQAYPSYAIQLRCRAYPPPHFGIERRAGVGRRAALGRRAGPVCCMTEGHRGGIA